jgi:hypothetical protein
VKLPRSKRPQVRILPGASPKALQPTPPDNACRIGFAPANDTVVAIAAGLPGIVGSEEYCA